MKDMPIYICDIRSILKVAFCGCDLEYILTDWDYDTVIVSEGETIAIFDFEQSLLHCLNLDNYWNYKILRYVITGNKTKVFIGSGTRWRNVMSIHGVHEDKWSHFNGLVQNDQLTLYRLKERRIA